MVQPGDVIENPVTGERITFLRTSAETGGALAEMELELRAPDRPERAVHQLVNRVQIPFASIHDDVLSA